MKNKTVFDSIREAPPQAEFLLTDTDGIVQVYLYKDLTYSAHNTLILKMIRALDDNRMSIQGKHITVDFAAVMESVKLMAAGKSLFLKTSTQEMLNTLNEALNAEPGYEDGSWIKKFTGLVKNR